MFMIGSAAIWGKRVAPGAAPKIVGLSIFGAPLQQSRVARRLPGQQTVSMVGSGTGMKLYRINKLTRPGGALVKKKHILAASDRKALEEARDSEDCPVCDVLRDGNKVGEVY